MLQAGSTNKKNKQKRKKTADKTRAAAAQADKTAAWEARRRARMEAQILLDVERRKRESTALKNAGAGVVPLHPIAIATVHCLISFSSSLLRRPSGLWSLPDKSYLLSP